jgi:hypothetical protein
MNKSQLKQIIREEIESSFVKETMTGSSIDQLKIGSIGSAEVEGDLPSRLAILRRVLMLLAFNKEEYAKVADLVNKNRQSFGTGFMGGNTEA